MDSTTKAELPNDGVLVIERAKWRRGAGRPGSTGLGKGETYLLNEQGFMCCLGFDAKARGLSDSQIRNVSTPTVAATCFIGGDSGYVPRAGVPASYAAYAESQEKFQPAMTANDAVDIPEESREAYVRDALIALGWNDVVFA